MTTHNNQTHPSKWDPTIRVGMPLVGGRLLKLGLETGLPLLFSANAFARVNRDREFTGFNIGAARALPQRLDAALDSAGFTASSLYPDYRWSLDQYLDLVAARQWAWAACPDYCVEPQIATDAAVRRLRIDSTITMYFRAIDAAARRSIAVPMLGVVQGWYADEYARCAERMFAGAWPRLIGLGSVCRRHLQGPDGVLAIVQALDQVLPAGTQLHLFGVKSGALGALAPYASRIAAVDSCAWDMQVRREIPVGRTQEVRARYMANWHRHQTQLVRRAHAQRRGLQASMLEAAPRQLSAREIALEATGQCLGELFELNDLSYLDVKWQTQNSAVLVGALLDMHGTSAFAQDEPEDDFGLGIVYGAVRDALVDAGHLQAACSAC